MKVGRILFLFFFFLCQAIRPSTAGESHKDTIYFSLPKLDWALEITVPGLVLKQKDVAANERRARFMGEDIKTGIVISAFLEEFPKPMTTEECRSLYWEKARKSPIRKDKMSKSTFGEMAVVEYVVKEHEGMKIDQKHLNAYLAKGKFCIDIHLSKVLFKEGEKKLFEAILKNIKTVPKKAEQKSEVKYALSKGRYARMIIPTDWADSFSPLRNRPESLITFTPPREKQARILITLIEGVDKTREFSTQEALRKFVLQSGNRLLPQSVEEEITIKKLEGETPGFYYVLTDKAPKPGEYRYLTQGVYKVGDVVLSFTILTNKKHSEEVKRALTLVSGTSIKKIEDQKKASEIKTTEK